MLLICIRYPWEFPTCIILRYLMSDWNRNGIRLQTMTVMKLGNNEMGYKSRAVWWNQILQPTIQFPLELPHLEINLSWSPIQINQDNINIKEHVYIISFIPSAYHKSSQLRCPPRLLSPFLVYSQTKWTLASMTIITTDQETIILGHCSHVTSGLGLFASEFCSLQLSLHPA